MRILMTIAVIAWGLGPLVATAGAAAPTRLTVTAPPAVSIGEEITIEARLTTLDGHPVAGARLALRQVGAVGERPMMDAVTDAQGAAVFVHREYTLAAIALRVAFAGDGAHGPSRADASVEISGIAPPPSVVMAHTPGPLVKSVLFSLLGIVWMTYLYAASRVVRVARDSRR